MAIISTTKVAIEMKNYIRYRTEILILIIPNVSIAPYEHYGVHILAIELG